MYPAPIPEPGYPMQPIRPAYPIQGPMYQGRQPPIQRYP